MGGDCLGDELRDDVEDRFDAADVRGECFAPASDFVFSAGLGTPGFLGADVGGDCLGNRPRLVDAVEDRFGAAPGFLAGFVDILDRRRFTTGVRVQETVGCFQPDGRLLPTRRSAASYNSWC